jgi:lipopolysaccharide/colanic/teichoic acid biosynthesis glycosyltransferase
LKRVIDLIGSAAGIVLLSPLLVCVAATLLIVQGRPVLFRQWRIGRNGQAFLLFKFRTMAVKADAAIGSFEPGRQARSTGLGNVLRRAKLDELPQLWNVLVGDMSLVGPRPEVRRWVLVYPDRWARVLTIRPGITDLASIEFRNEEDLLASTTDPEVTYRETVLPRKLDCYERYIAEGTLSGDLAILVRTMSRVIRG